MSAASRVARVRLSPAPATFGSRRVSRRSDWALPSKPPQASAPPGSASAARADSPLWPNGGWPRSCARQAASTRSGSQPSAAPSSRPICAHSSEWVSRVRGKSPEPALTTCVFAASLRSAELCRTRARSRWNSVRPGRLGGSATQRSVSPRTVRHLPSVTHRADIPGRRPDFERRRRIVRRERVRAPVRCRGPRRRAARVRPRRGRDAVGRGPAGSGWSARPRGPAGDLTGCRCRRSTPRPGRPQGGRSGRGTVSRTRSRGPPRGRTRPRPGRRRARRRRRA